MTTAATASMGESTRLTRLVRPPAPKVTVLCLFYARKQEKTDRMR